MRSQLIQSTWVLVVLLVASGTIMAVPWFARLVMRSTILTANGIARNTPAVLSLLERDGLVFLTTVWAKVSPLLRKFAKRDERTGKTPKSNGSPYEQALDTLGFPRGHQLTRRELKERQQELLRMVHPDKGCPTQAFAQLVNSAVQTIKATHGWR